MNKLVRVSFILALALFCSAVSTGQQKYAVLIGGPIDESHWDMDTTNPSGWFDPEYLDFFWTDIFLMNNLLTKKLGFPEDNVTMLFDKGVDYSPPLQNGKTYHPRYKKPNLVDPDITDFSCIQDHVRSVLTDLQSTSTKDDFVFIFVFTHGKHPGNAPPYEFGILCPVVIRPEYDYGNEDYIPAPEFTELVADIPAAKKVIWMQPCFSGGFEPIFAEYMPGGSEESPFPFIVHYSTSDSTEAWACDNIMPWGTTITSHNENEPPEYSDPSNGYNGWPSACHHGEFAYHLYSALAGETPTIGETEYPGHPYNIPISTADANEDGVVSVAEDFNWATTYATYELGGDPIRTQEFFSGISDITSLEYPTLLCQDITDDLSVNGIIGISTEVHVTGCSLSINGNNFGNNTVVYFTNDSAKLVIDAGATLHCFKHITIWGNSTNSIEINGSATFDGANITIKSPEPAAKFGNLTLNNASFTNSVLDANIQTQAFQNTTFLDCDTIRLESGTITVTNSQFSGCNLFQTQKGNLVISECEFTGCGSIKIFNNRITISNATFVNSGIYHENPSWNDQSEATIFNNTFSNSSGPEIPAIELYFVPRFNIHHNNISSIFNNGIQLSYSGFDALEYQKVWMNFISGCFNTGISILNTNLIVQNNHIYNNGFGVRLFGKSTVHLIGDGDAQLNTQTQEILNNGSFEVYASRNSFPPCFRYNIIQDEDNIGNPTDPLVYYSTEYGPSDNIHLTVSYNCWGDNFSPESDLIPVSEYYYLPFWCPTEIPQPNNDPPQDMYNLAVAQFNDSNYFYAKETCKLLVELYHESRYAQSAMIDLLRVERFAGNDYMVLKEYFLGNDSIVNDTMLAPLGISLSNECDIILGNYQDAIDFYEGIILNPTTAEDSILAIVDLGHVYYLMEQSPLKTGYTGILPQFKPTSREDYFNTRDYLLSLLPVTKDTKSINEPRVQKPSGKLIHNIPNPASESTTIFFEVEQPAEVIIRITDITGKPLKNHPVVAQRAGIQKVTISLQELAPGVYMYSLIMDQKITDTKKLTVIR